MFVQKDAIVGLDVLTNVAIKGLSTMYDQNAQLFCERAVKQEHGVYSVGHSHWETYHALLGLNEAFHYDLKIPLNVESITERFIAADTPGESIGHLGSYLWLVARAMPQMLASKYDILDLPGALERFNSDKTGTTRALSFFLIGLSELRLSDAEEPVYLDEVAYMTKQLLFVNYGGFGVFRSLVKGGISAKKKNPYGSIIDQVFTMYAFTRYARAFEDEHALVVARECATNLLQNQGELGQWWSLYEVATGTVARTFPVYSMNQDALVPMALLAVAEQTGDDYLDAISYGMQWLFAHNEMDLRMVDPGLSMIWEGVHDGKSKLYQSDGRAFDGLKPQRGKNKVLNVVLECRPSHLGWLLYTLSGYMEGT